MRNLFIFAGIAGVAAVGIVLLRVQQDGVRAPVSETQEAEETQEADTQLQPLEETQLQAQLPGPLRPELPGEIPTPDNPCSNLSVREEVRAKRNALANAAAQAEARNREVLNAVTLPHELIRGNPQQRSVALTIDTGTGGAEGVAELLTLARHYDIALTFFLTGCWVLENPALTQQIVSDGHSVGNHSLTHANLGKFDDAAAKREIEETDRILEETTGFRPVLFRKPHYAGGERITVLAGKLRKVSVQGFPNLGDTAGWRMESTAGQVYERITSTTAPGAIWVLHNLSPADLHAFEDVVRFHLEEGYKLVRVEEMLVQ